MRLGVKRIITGIIVISFIMAPVVAQSGNRTTLTYLFSTPDRTNENVFPMKTVGVYDVAGELDWAIVDYSSWQHVVVVGDPSTATYTVHAEIIEGQYDNGTHIRTKTFEYDKFFDRGFGLRKMRQQNGVLLVVREDGNTSISLLTISRIMSGNPVDEKRLFETTSDTVAELLYIREADLLFVSHTGNASQEKINIYNTRSDTLLKTLPFNAAEAMTVSLEHDIASVTTNPDATYFIRYSSTGVDVLFNLTGTERIEMGSDTLVLYDGSPNVVQFGDIPTLLETVPESATTINQLPSRALINELVIPSSNIDSSRFIEATNTFLVYSDPEDEFWFYEDRPFTQRTHRLHIPAPPLLGIEYLHRVPPNRTYHYIAKNQSTDIGELNVYATNITYSLAAGCRPFTQPNRLDQLSDAKHVCWLPIYTGTWILGTLVQWLLLGVLIAIPIARELSSEIATMATIDGVLVIAMVLGEVSPGIVALALLVSVLLSIYGNRANLDVDIQNDSI